MNDNNVMLHFSNGHRKTMECWTLCTEGYNQIVTIRVRIFVVGLTFAP